MILRKGQKMNRLQKINSHVAHIITRCIDFFYPPFSRWLPQQIFRYGMAGTGNMLFDWVLYFLCYNFVYCKQVVDLHFIAFTPHIASLFTVFPITFLTGFWLARYVSFSESNLRSHVQMMRYLMVVATCLLINYFGLKLCVEVLHFYPTPSKMLLTAITTLFSYLSQKHFSFCTSHHQNGHNKPID